MKKNLTAIFAASSVAVMALGSTLAAYGADGISDILSSISGRSASVESDSFSFSAGGVLTIKSPNGFDEWQNADYSIVRDDVKSVIIDGDGETAITEIPDDAFKNCTALESLVLSASCLTKIGDGAFEDCTSLDSISTTVNNMVDTIGDRAFKGCTALVELDFTIFGGYGGTGYGYVDLGESAFEGCTSLLGVKYDGEEIEEPRLNLLTKVRYVGNNAFKGCTSLKYVFAGAGDLRSIGESAFEGCIELRHVNFNDVGYNYSIGVRAFAYCYRLWKISLGSCVSIENQAFYNTYVEGIKVSSFIQRIASDAFDVSEEYKIMLDGNLTYRYILFDGNQWGISESTRRSFYGTLPDNIIGLIYENIYDEDYTITNINITVETDISSLPEDEKVPIPEGIAFPAGTYDRWCPIKTVYALGSDGVKNELDDSKYKTTYCPTDIKVQAGSQGESLPTFNSDRDPEYPNGIKDYTPPTEPDPDDNSEQSEPLESSEPESSEPESSEPESSEPESSEPESSEPESSEPESSEPESSDPESSDPESSEPESSEPESSEPESSEPESSEPDNNPGDNPNTGTMCIVPIVFVSAAIAVVTVKRKSLK